MYILGRNLTGGLRAGVAAALGITAGSIVHTLAAATGLSLLLATSPLAFSALKLAGGAYLIFLGARLLFTSSSKRLQPDPQVKPARRSVWLARCR